jgi:xanthine dehydrogenase accessory factor
VKPDVLITDLDFDIGSMDLGERDHVVVLTKGGRDLEVLEKLSRKKVGYVGLVASRKRVTHNVAQLRARGVPEEFIRNLSAPAGIDIGAYTPEEVALSVMAEIVARIRGVRVRRKGEEEVAELVQGGEAGAPKVAERVEVQLSEAGCALPERGGG